MAKKILVSYNFQQNEIQNAVAHLVAGDPGTPVNGQFWYDSTAHLMKWQANGVIINPLARANHSGTQSADIIVDGTTNKAYTATEQTKLAGIATGATANDTDANLKARANHTGTQLAATISDFDTQVRTNRLDQMAAPTASVSLNSQKITNLLDGSSAQDAATYGQLQGVANGRQFKDAVRCATTANLGALSGLLTVDGITLVAGDRILVKDQTTGADNGIYVAGSGAWTRSTDTDNTSPDTEVKTGMSVMVSEGTANADKQFSLTTNGAITIGTTSLTFAQTGSGTTYTEGNGIDIAGSVISVDPAVVVRKYAVDIGDNSATSITVTHGLGTKDVTVSVRQVSDDAHVECDVVSTSTTQTTFIFAVAPATASLRVVVHG